MKARPYTNAKGATLAPPQSFGTWREFFGLSQQAVAEMAHVSISSVVNIEKNRQVPTFDVAVQLADALGVSPMEVTWPTKATRIVRPRKKEERPAA